MTMHLFTGIAGDWYRQRLQHMYKVRPRCPLLFTMNHMLGACPTCGPGRYGLSKLFRLQQLPIDRVYTVLIKSGTELTDLVYAQSRWPRLLTNVEFPLPIIRYHTSVHIPMFFDPMSNTVIDFFPNNKSRRRIIRAVDSVLSPAGFKYLALSGTLEIYRSSRAQEDARKAQNLIAALQAVLDNAALGDQSCPF